MAKWEFPIIDIDVVYGLNSSIETYKDEPFIGLAKEICQNSLDAAINTDKEVKLEFSPFILKNFDFPDIDYFKESITKLIAFNKKTHINDMKSVDFYERALNILKTQEIKCLRISDSNTTGLDNVDSNTNSSWYNLVKAEGDSDKTSGMGGSFGVGKFAPYAVSDLRTVFYSTLNIKQQKATQGLARLSTFELNGKKTLGKGYCGESGGRHTQDLKSLDKFYKRKEAGTDLFILGLREDEDWDTKTIAAIIDNYFLSIFEKSIEVKIENFLINSLTIKRFVADEKIIKYMSRYTLNYIEVYNTSKNEVTIKGSILSRDDCEIKITYGLDKLKNSIAMTRKNGMKVFDKKIKSNLYYSGIFRIRSLELDDFLKKLENTKHDNWSYERIDDPVKKKNASKIVKKIEDLIISEIRKIENLDIKNTTDVVGLSEYLPDDIGDESRKSIETIEKQLNDGISIKDNKPIQANSNSDKQENTSSENDEGEDSQKNTKETDKTLNQSENKLKFKEVNDGDIIFNKMLVNKNQYVLNVKINHKVKKLVVKVLLASEKGNYDIAIIKSVKQSGSNYDISVDKSEISISGEDIRDLSISFEIVGKSSLPIEVIYYESL